MNENEARVTADCRWRGAWPDQMKCQITCFLDAGKAASTFLQSTVDPEAKTGIANRVVGLVV